MTTPILEARDLSKLFPSPKKLFTPARFVTAVDRVSLSVLPGETLAIVGESGSGKSTLGRLLLRLLGASEGRVFYQGEEITHASGARLNQLRRELQIIFQDPFASLNPRMTVEQIVGEPLWLHQNMKKADRQYHVAELLRTVGLPAAWAGRYPHEFSGGQRQRIGIARALIMNPEFIIADEPISALDVSIRAQVLNLMAELQRRRGLTYLLISHDLSVMRFICDRIAVIHLGRIVELSSTEKLFAHPLHPYTKGLLGSIPVANPKLARKKVNSSIEGDIPSPINPPTGCRFHTRCPYAKPECAQVMPQMKDMGGGHMVACHLYDDTRVNLHEKA